jgi:hypothetical protein
MYIIHCQNVIIILRNLSHNHSLFLEMHEIKYNIKVCRITSRLARALSTKHIGNVLYTKIVFGSDYYMVQETSKWLNQSIYFINSTNKVSSGYKMHETEAGC